MMRKTRSRLRAYRQSMNKELRVDVECRRRWGCYRRERRVADGASPWPQVGRRRELPRCKDNKKEVHLDDDMTYLQSGASGVALLLLGTIDARSLTARALASRRFSFSTSHCV